MMVINVYGDGEERDRGSEIWELHSLFHKVDQTLGIALTLS